MADPKITPPLAAFALEKSRAGFSLREIAAWFGTAHHVTVTAEGVRGALERARKAEAADAAGGKGAEGKRGKRAAVAATKDEDETDVEVLDRVIAELEEDVEKARLAGATQALVVLRRLHLDALERRRKLMPPAPVEADADALAAGQRAVDRLARLVEAERGRLAEGGA